MGPKVLARTGKSINSALHLLASEREAGCSRGVLAC